MTATSASAMPVRLNSATAASYTRWRVCRRRASRLVSLSSAAGMVPHSYAVSLTLVNDIFQQVLPACLALDYTDECSLTPMMGGTRRELRRRPVLGSVRL